MASPAGTLSGRLLLLIALLLSSDVFAGGSSQPLLIDSSEQQLGPYSSIYFDPGGKLSAQAALTRNYVDIVREFVPFPDVNGSYWLRFSLKNNTPYREKRIFSFDYPHIEDLSLYVIENGIAKKISSTSAETPLPEREVNSRFSVMRFDVDADKTTEYLLHIKLRGKANHALEYKLQIFPESDFYGTQIESFVIFAGFIGFMLSLLIYNMILYRQMAIIGYLYYSIYLIGQIIGVTSYEGFLYLLPWPFSIDAVIVLVTIAPTLCGVFLINFGANLLQVGQRMPRVSKFYWYVSIVLLLMLLCSPVGWGWLNVAMEALMVFMMVFTAIVSVIIYRQGSQPAKYFALSFAFITVGYGVEVLLFSVDNLDDSLGFLSADQLYWVERYFFYTCSFFQMNLLSSALASSMVEIRDENNQAQRLVLEQMEESNRLREAYSAQLEHDIEERTAKISRQSEIMAKQTKRLQQLDKLKSRFFANLSHEFRTPLTLIRGPVQRFLAGDYGNVGDKAYSALKICARNIERLARMIDELLMLSELESGSLELKASRADINQFCLRTASLFAHQAQDRDIEFKVQVPDNSRVIYFDAGKLETIICNLLTNAFKYTPRGGIVQLSLLVPEDDDKSTGNFIEIVVEDNGPGISKAEQASIFQRFYRAASTDDYAVEGSGIGLALVKELAELQGGDVRLESCCASEGLSGTASFAGSGCRFTVSLPLGSDHLEQHEIARLPQMLGLGQLEPDETLAGRPATQQLDTAASLLVVEDNKDMRDFIVSQFDQAYRVLEAAQGKQALELLAANRVDLVISDVMMPEMDGISLLEAIRNDETLNTMPVILLTARASDEDRLLALRAKADDFLAKPFNAEELGLKVSNLLERRSAITAESRAVAASEVPAPLDSVDAAFLEKAREITLQRLGEMDFDVDGLAEGLHMSRSTLRRHMEKAANMTPAQFIRQLRLELAHSYITGQCHRTLAETAFAVGFNHPGYFSKLYKKYTAELAATRDS